MKKINQILITLFLTIEGFWLRPVAALAQTDSDITTAPINLKPTGISNITENLTPASLVAGGIKLILLLAALLFFFMLVIGGIQWIISGGDKTKSEEARKRITSALVGSIASFIAVFLAPGNAIRQSLLPKPPQPFQIILLSFRFATGFLRGTLKGAPIPNLFSLIVPALVVYILHAGSTSIKSKQPLWIALLAVPVTAYLLVVCICAPSVYAESAYPEARALLPAQFILTGALVAEGALFGSFFRQLISTLKLKPTSFVLLVTLLLGLSSLYPLRMAKLITAVIPEYRERALLWDQRDDTIRTARDEGIADIEVKALDSFGGLMELGPDSNLWVNRCAAAFYGVNSITATSP